MATRKTKETKVDWQEVTFPDRPPLKDSVHLRIDRDVIEWFRKLGPGYQTRINTVLRHFVVSQKERDGHAA